MGPMPIRKAITPLTTKLTNQTATKVSMPASSSAISHTQHLPYRPQPNSKQQVKQEALEANPTDQLMAKLCENYDQATAQNVSSEDAVSGNPSSCSSLPVTPATDNFDTFVGTGPTTRPASAAPNDRAASDEVLRLKLELAKAQNHISRVEQELVHTRRENQDSGRATPVMSSDSDFTGGAPLVDPIVGPKPSGIPSQPGPSKPQFSQAANWQGPVPEDCRSDVSDPVSATGFNHRSRGIWNNNGAKSGYQSPFPPPSMPMQDVGPAGNWSQPRNQSFMEQSVSPYPGPAMDGYRGDRYSQDPDLLRSGGGRRGSRYDNNRFGGQSYGSGYGGYNMGGMGQGQYDTSSNYAGAPSSNMSGGNMGMFPQYGQPVGTPLSPHATEFTSAAASSWKPEVSPHPSTH